MFDFDPSIDDLVKVKEMYRQDRGSCDRVEQRRVEDRSRREQVQRGQEGREQEERDPWSFQGRQVDDREEERRREERRRRMEEARRRELEQQYGHLPEPERANRIEEGMRNFDPGN